MLHCLINIAIFDDALVHNLNVVLFNVAHFNIVFHCCTNIVPLMIDSPQLTFTCSNSTIRITRNIRKKCETFLKSTIKTAEQRQSRRSGDFIVNFEYRLHLILVFLLLTLGK